MMMMMVMMMMTTMMIQRSTIGCTRSEIGGAREGEQVGGETSSSGGRGEGEEEARCSESA